MALQAAVLLVGLLPEFNGLARGCRPAWKFHGLGDTLGDREIGGEGLEVVGEIRHFRIRQGGPPRHRGVGHATPDDGDEVLMGRERSAGSRPNLELAAREVAWPGEQVLGGIPVAVSLLAVALDTVLKVERLARLTLRVGPKVGTLCAHRSCCSHRPHRPCTHRDEQDSDTRQQLAGGHSCDSRARGLSPVKS